MTRRHSRAGTGRGGARIDVQHLGCPPSTTNSEPTAPHVPTRVWSNGGTVDLGKWRDNYGSDDPRAGRRPAGSRRHARSCSIRSSISTPRRSDADAVSEEQIAAAGFSTFVGEGSINSAGNATIDLDRGFFLTSLPYDGQTIPTPTALCYDNGGRGRILTIEAPYIGLDSVEQTRRIAQTRRNLDNNSVTLRADDIDVLGAVEFDNSVANVTFDARGNVRFIGVQPADITLGILDGSDTSDTLQGQLVVSGNLTIDAAQVYPTTGSTFYVTSSAADGTIAVSQDHQGRASGSIFGGCRSHNPSAEYCAGRRIARAGRQPDDRLRQRADADDRRDNHHVGAAHPIGPGSSRQHHIGLRGRTRHSVRHDDGSDGMVFRADELGAADRAACRRF